MKDRFNRAKQYVVNHKKTFVAAGVGVTLGWKIASMLEDQHTFLSITQEELQTLLDDSTLVAHYNIAKHNAIHLVQVPSHQ